MYCPSCGGNNPEGAGFCQNCGAAMTPPAPEGSTAETKPLGMKWHKFMIYCAMFLAALTNFSGGIQAISGIQYGEDAEWFYFLYDGLKALDVIYGVLLIAVAGFILYTRHQLARMKRNAPKLIVTLYACTLLMSLAYPCLLAAITGINVFDVSVVVNLLSALVMAVINILYYRKRSHLFVNF
ncbi:MAG: hypothetical protein ACI4O0_00985 [Candidatus Limivicinus sp.]